MQHWVWPGKWAQHACTGACLLGQDVRPLPALSKKSQPCPHATDSRQGRSIHSMALASCSAHCKPLPMPPSRAPTRACRPLIFQASHLACLRSSTLPLLPCPSQFNALLALPLSAPRSLHVAARSSCCTLSSKLRVTALTQTY